MQAIYTFHPDFLGSTVWWGDPERDWGLATFEGGDIMPVGKGVVLMGMSERTSRQAITQVAARATTQWRRTAGRGPPGRSRIGRSERRVLAAESLIPVRPPVTGDLSFPVASGYHR